MTRQTPTVELVMCGVEQMANWKLLLLLGICCLMCAGEDSEDTELYYYGLEESERNLPECNPRQACAAVVRRYWRRAALVRLCRCPRRRRCDTPLPRNMTIELNNRAYFQFCNPVTGWPICSFEDTPLTVATDHDRLNPDELEQLHDKNIHFYPPKVDFSCRCREPNYWKLNVTAETDKVQIYSCGSMTLCKTGDACGNVSEDLFAVYQSCSCPENHICVHNGGVTNHNITELLYRGKGWTAYCRNIGDQSDED